MPTLESSIVIHRPIEDVFNYSTDLARHAEWKSGLLHAEMSSPGAVRTGATYTYQVQVMGRKIETNGEVVDFAPPFTFQWKATSGPFPMSGSTTYEEISDGTRVTDTIVVEPGGFFKLAEPLLIRQQQSQMKADLEKLKKLLEGS
jgi:uncharacterized membrane protein